MNKPVIVAMEDLENTIVNAINNANLHIAVIKSIVDKVKLSVDKEYLKTRKKEQEQYANDKEIPEQEVIPNEKIQQEQSKEEKLNKL